MKLTLKIFLMAGALAVLAACTPRRTDSPPEADGDTVEVVINE